MAKLLTLITGANGVIGTASSKLFLSKGVPLILGCRTSEKAEGLIKHLATTTGSSAPSPIALPLDLSSIASTKSGAERIAKLVDSTQVSEVVLIQNAGALFKTRRTTSDGIEETLQANYIAPVLLNLILSKHLASSSQVTSIRNVFVSANAYKTASINWSDLEFQGEESKYDGWKAYTQAKRMQVTLSRLLASENYSRKLNDLLKVDPQKAPSRLWFSLDPGWVKSNLVRTDYGWTKEEYSKMMEGGKNTPEEAAEVIWTAASTPASPSPSSSGITNGDFLVRGKAQKVIPGVEDPVEQEKLWRFTQEVFNTFH